jgi:hypothetical protein
VLVTAGEASQLSVTVGGVQFTTALQVAGLVDTLMFAGQLVNTGLVLSVTVMVNEHVSLLPAASVASYVTVCTPNVNIEPGVFVVVTTGEASQLSVTVGGVQLTTALHVAVAATLMFAGQLVNIGLVASVTVTVNEQVSLLPAASVAS